MTAIPRIKSAKVKSQKPVPAAKRKPAAAGPVKALLKLIEQALEDGQAEMTVVIDLQGKSSIADYMLVASGRSQRQVAALAERLLATLRAKGHRRVSAEGLPHGDWVLIDAGDVIVHLFRPESRSRYNLEKMWGEDFTDPATAER
ncbi:MAG: ribosome silencing factor [Stellaceae bacterium]